MEYLDVKQALHIELWDFVFFLICDESLTSFSYKIADLFSHE